MLNEESRKYFSRAFLASGSALSYFALTEGNHLERMQEFSKINDEKKLIEYLRGEDSKVLAGCHSFTGFGKLLSSPWTPTIEHPSTIGAIIAEKPEKMFTSGKATAIDALFSFTGRVSNTYLAQPNNFRHNQEENWYLKSLFMPISTLFWHSKELIVFSLFSIFSVVIVALIILFIHVS